MKCQHSPHLLCPHGHGHLANHAHHHTHGQSFPSPSTTSVAHHAQQQVVPACCGGALAYSASSTLPTNASSSTEPAHCNYRTRTLPNLTPCGQTPANSPYAQLLVLSPRTIGLFALSLVFILIWSSVISGVLVTHSLKEHETAIHTAELFELHQNVGQFAFEVGQEMRKFLRPFFSCYTS